MALSAPTICILFSEAAWISDRSCFTDTVLWTLDMVFFLTPLNYESQRRIQENARRDFHAMIPIFQQ